MTIFVDNGISTKYIDTNKVANFDGFTMQVLMTEYVMMGHSIALFVPKLTDTVIARVETLEKPLANSIKLH